MAEFVAEGLRDVKSHAGRLLGAGLRGARGRLATRGDSVITGDLMIEGLVTIGGLMAVFAGEGFFENAREVFSGDTDAVVGNFKDGFIIGGCGGNRDGLALIFDAIKNNLVEDKLEPLGVGKNFVVEVVDGEVDVAREKEILILGGDSGDDFG